MTVVFHIGLHKTGSTFLQRQVFPTLFREAHYLSKKQAKVALRSQLFYPNKINFFSEENWSNSIKKPQEGWSNFCDFTEQLSCLNASEIKIIIFLRNHADWLWSAYLHELKMSRKRNTSFEEYAYSFGEKGLSWSDRIGHLSKFSLMVVNYQDFLNDPVFVMQKIALFSGLESLNISALDRNTRQNLTPKTKATMAACQKFERGYQFTSNSIKYITGHRLSIEPVRESVRDSIISFVAKNTPNSARIERPDLPQELQKTFDADWQAVWSKLDDNENSFYLA